MKKKRIEINTSNENTFGFFSLNVRNSETYIHADGEIDRDKINKPHCTLHRAALINKKILISRGEIKWWKMLTNI